MCKIWQCKVDDDKFEEITHAQRLWYSLNIIKDEEDEAKKSRNMLEYLASFWDSEAVQKMRDLRDSHGSERFDSKEEFDKKIEDGELFDREIFDKIKEQYKNTNLNITNDGRAKGARDASLPKDLTGLLGAIKDGI